MLWTPLSLPLLLLVEMDAPAARSQDESVLEDSVGRFYSCVAVTEVAVAWTMRYLSL